MLSFGGGMSRGRLVYNITIAFKADYFFQAAVSPAAKLAPSLMVFIFILHLQETAGSGL